MALNIPLCDGWRLRSDRYNIILCEMRGDKEIDTFFYSTIQGAIEGFVEMKIKGFNANTLVGLQNSIILLNKRLNEALRGLNLVCVPKNMLENTKEIQNKLK